MAMRWRPLSVLVNSRPTFSHLCHCSVFFTYLVPLTHFEALNSMDSPLMNRVT